MSMYVCVNNNNFNNVEIIQRQNSFYEPVTKRFLLISGKNVLLGSINSFLNTFDNLYIGICVCMNNFKL